MEKNNSNHIIIQKLMDFLLRISKLRPGNKNVHKNPVKMDKKQKEDLSRRMDFIAHRMEERSLNLSEKGNHFKSMILRVRSEQLAELNDSINSDSLTKKGVPLNYEDMAKDLQSRVEQRMEAIGHTDIYKQAQHDFEKDMITQDELISLDQDLIKETFDPKNPVHASLIGYLNKTTEIYHQRIQEIPKSKAEENGINVSPSRKWGHSPEHSKTSVEEARRERAEKDRPDTLSTENDSNKGGYEKLMPNKNDVSEFNNPRM